MAARDNKAMRPARLRPVLGDQLDPAGAQLTGFDPEREAIGARAAQMLDNPDAL